MSPKTFLLIGRSGAGKGTQAKLLCEYIKKNDKEANPLFYVETGDHFRKFIEKDGYSNKLAGEISHAGFKQPDFLAVWNWADLMLKNMEENTHLIMDGSPRSLPEAEILNGAFTFYNRKNPIIIYIHVSLDWANLHLKERGRIDDSTEKHMQNKIKWFDQDVMPAIDYFINSPKYSFEKINGEQPMEKVHEDIIKAIQWQDQ